MDFNKVRNLLQRYHQGVCSPEEITLVEQWYDQLVKTGEASFSEQEMNKLQQTIESHLMQQIATPVQRPPHDLSDNEPAVLPLVHRIPFIRPLRWAAAASILLTLGISSYFLFNKTVSAPANTTQSITVINDVQAPTSNRATITLANGQQIALDDIANGQLATQANVKIIKSANDEISYQTVADIPKDIPNNILSNPRGSKVVSMTLSDGTRVWLNAGSSLTYPVAFTGKERIVSITGEAYFEVAKNKDMPFSVKKDALTIQVLGTHFNVNAYEDESAARVTLFEGAVNVTQGGYKALLKPAQQVLLYNGSGKIVNDVDISEVMAWKDGLFIFKGEDINTIMRQIARWYDVDVQYEKPVSEKFYLKMDRRTNVSNVFKILEATGGVHFSINEKKIMVRP